MRPLAIAFLPLVLLLALSVLAGVVGYGLVLLFPSVPLNQMISKATLVFLLLSLFPAKRWLKLSWQDMGFAKPNVFCLQWVKGFGLGLATLLPVIAILSGLEVQVIDETKTWTPVKLASRLGVALLLAMLISFLEEPLFRGVLLSGLAKKLPLVQAVLISAVYYGGLHFLTNKTQVPVDQVSLAAAFDLLAGAYANWFNLEILSAFLSLVMVGIFLGALRTQIKASLAWCIGCHAAWVWQIKACKDLFNIDSQSPYLFLISPYDGVIGPLVSLWLLLGLMACLFYRHRVQHRNGLPQRKA